MFIIICLAICLKLTPNPLTDDNSPPSLLRSSETTWESLRHSFREAKSRMNYTADLCPCQRRLACAGASTLVIIPPQGPARPAKESVPVGGEVWGISRAHYTGQRGTGKHRIKGSGECDDQRNPKLGWFLKHQVLAALTLGAVLATVMHLSLARAQDQVGAEKLSVLYHAAPGPEHEQEDSWFPRQREIWFQQQRAYPNAHIPQGAYWRAQVQKRALAARHLAMRHAMSLEQAAQAEPFSW